MHYKNGREAKAGDIVVRLPQYPTEKPVAGMLYNLNAQSKTCNGNIAQVTYNDPCVTIGECLHIDDIKAAEIPDQTKNCQ